MKDHRKIVNIERFARRIEENCTQELLEKFEKDMFAAWNLLTPDQKERIDALHKRLQNRDKVSVPQTKTSQPVDDLERENIERELLEMARALKSSALEFKECLSKDNVMLESISKNQFKHLITVKKETNKIDSIQVKTSFWATLRSLFAVILSFFLFIIVFIIIRTFPHKHYIYSNPT